MPKVHSQYICQQCSYQSASYLGKCPQCGQWNSLVESVPDSTRNFKFKISNLKFEENLLKLSEVKSGAIPRFSSGFFEFDRVLGGGIVPGSLVLVAGEPGIGKSTLLLQCAMKIAELGKGKGKEAGMGKGCVLYVTGEESAQQVRIRADRLIAGSQLSVHPTASRLRGASSSQKGKKTVDREQLTDNLYILSQTDVEMIGSAFAKLNPRLVIVDSIQTLTSAKLTGGAGSIGQVRECAQILQAHAKATHTAVFIVGHVTKEGAVAGPKVLEHLVDAVLNLEGDNLHAYRILRSTKNRFGSTFEVGVFEMTDGGMLEISNPSQIFLAQRIGDRAGSVVASTITGQRPILAEIQALATSSIFGMPVRRTTGLDFARVQIVMAALSRAANLSLGNLDIYVNVAGGLRIAEPACDLPVALAIVSATLGKPLREGVCVYGEVGLLGELRPVGNTGGRMSEAKRLGFSDFISPERFKTLEEAISYAIHESV